MEQLMAHDSGRNTKVYKNVMGKKYETPYIKLKRLKPNKYRPTQSNNLELYLRLENHTDIKFSPVELELRIKRLK